MENVVEVKKATLLPLPSTNVAPYVNITQFFADAEAMPIVEALLLRSIPIYWKQSGLMDVKVLKAKSKKQFTVIVSWENEEFAIIGDNSQDWTLYDKLWNEHIKSDQVRIKEIVSDQFELIE